MKKYLIFMLAFLLLVPVSFVTYSQSDGEESQYIIIFNTNEKLSEVEVAVKGLGLQSKKLNILNGIVFKGSDRALEILKEKFEIVSVEPDFEVTALPKPDRPGKPDKPDDPEDPPVGQVIDWGVKAIKADQVWNSYLGDGVNVAVIDTGIDKDHPDLNVVGGANFVARAKSYDDDNGHGTHVAGTIAALDNSIGVKGVAPNANLYAVKVLDRKGSGYTSDVILGIEWAANNNMDVVNLSLGSDYYSSAMEAAINYANDNGVIVVAAAGNDASEIDFPGAYVNTIAVGAVDSNLELAYFSSIGPELDVVAPGVNINSTYKGGDYKVLNGTSMATPHVAGLAVLYREQNPTGSLDDFRTALQNSSSDLGDTGFDIYYGHGFVDAVNLLGN